jgi:WD40 repeat protein
MSFFERSRDARAHFAKSVAVISLLFHVMSVTLETRAEQILHLQSPAPVTALIASPDGVKVIAGSQAGLATYQVDHQNKCLRFEKSLTTRLENIHDLAISPDGRLLFAAGGTPGEAGKLEVFELASGESKFHVRLHEDLIYGIDLTADGKRVVTAGADGTVAISDASEAGTVMKFKGHSNRVLDAVFLVEDRFVSSSVDHTIRLWSIDQHSNLKTFSNHLDRVLQLALRPATQGESALPLVASISSDKTVRFWQPTIGRMVRFARLESTPTCVAWSPTGKAIYVGTESGALYCFDPETAEQLRQPKIFPKRIVSLSAITPTESGQYFLVIGMDNGFLELLLAE